MCLLGLEVGCIEKLIMLGVVILMSVLLVNVNWWECLNNVELWWESVKNWLFLISFCISVSFVYVV